MATGRSSCTKMQITASVALRLHDNSSHKRLILPKINPMTRFDWVASTQASLPMEWFPNGKAKRPADCFTYRCRAQCKGCSGHAQHRMRIVRVRHSTRNHSSSAYPALGPTVLQDNMCPTQI